jgi:hypothetical protein
MNSIRLFLYTFLLLALTACQPSTPAIPDLPKDSMKGYELYSWQEGEQWYFSVLVGTNREKTLEEIQAPDVTLKDLDALKLALGKIQSGQYIGWSTREGLDFPPDAMVREVQKICKDRGLELNIAK